MTQITLQLSDDLAERLAPFQDRLLELLERGLRDMLNAPAAHRDKPQQRLKALANLQQLRSCIREKDGIYQGDLVNEAR
ncbi:MAG: hypothetical protein AAFY41_06870, partial [Bacteroidota bacterium]